MDNRNPKKKEEMYPEALKTLKQNIRQLRKDKGFKSADSFAEYLNVSLKTVQGWEGMNNNRWPDLAMMINLCEKTGCDLDYLLGRMKEPTHGIKYIHEKTGLSVEAIKMLINLKDTGLDELFSEILTHKNAAHLFRVMLLASDENEMKWMNMNELPRNLFSTYADKAYDLSAGIGADVSDFLASQELTGILKDIRERREKERKTGVRKDPGRADLYDGKESRKNLEHDIVETAIQYDFNSWDTYIDDEYKRRKMLLEKLGDLFRRVDNCSYILWQRNSGDLYREYEKIRKELEKNG